MPEAANGSTATTTAPQTTSQAGLTSGTSNAGWLSSDLAKQYPTVGKFKDLWALAKSYSELERTYNASPRVPGPDATPEDWDAFYGKLGRPEAPDKYEIKFAEGTAVDDNLLGAFRGVAHKIGLTQQQAQQLGEWWASQAQGMAESTDGEVKADLETWDKELTTDWGWQKERNIGLAGRAFNTAIEGTDFGPQLVEFLDNTGLGNHPLMVKLFHHLAMKSGEDKLVTADTGPTADDRQTAGEQIRAIRADKSHPYNDVKSPAHKDAVRHMQALYEIAYAKEEG